ncbi:MAG: hypothetical protein PVI63_05500 [Anaerolineae bacterium]|jgi:heme O synthase-like polyprenyltransferase
MVFGRMLVALRVGIALRLSASVGVVIAVGVLFDLVVYTPWLKRRSARSLVFGGTSGRMPILAGRALGIGRMDLAVLPWVVRCYSSRRP